MHIDRTPARRSLISLTPLIDMVFILLVFFMLASSFLQWRFLTLDIPSLTSTGHSIEVGAILIRLKSDGTVDLNGESLSADGLESRVSKYLQRDADQHVLIQAQADIPLQRIVSVLDALTRLGAQNLSLIGS